jgi:ABC-type antimicrobial peptide transport system permease subunit
MARHFKPFEFFAHTAAFLGAYAPACRASRIDPMVALRHQ